MLQQPEEWVDKIREEWRILAEYLPGMSIHEETLIL